MSIPGTNVCRLRRAAALLAVTVIVTVGTACSGGDSSEDAIVTPTQAATAAAAATATPAASTPTQAAPAGTTPAGATEGAAPEDGPTVGIGTDADGEHLVGPNGLALYFFANDEAGMSNCTGGCAEDWPPLTVESGETPTAAAGVAGMIETIAREDGSQQITLDARPLYFFAGDSAPGDVNGDGLGGVWTLARPDATGAAGAGAAGGSSTGTSSGSGGTYDYGD